MQESNDIRLPLHADFALRFLMLLALNPQQSHAVEEVATRCRIARDRLAKVSQTLMRAGFVKGHGCGLHLAKPAAHINLGAVLRATDRECDIQVVTPDGGRRAPFSEELPRLTGVLDRYSLADLMANAGSPYPLVKCERMESFDG